jgi:hypothetical protein
MTPFVAPRTSTLAMLTLVSLCGCGAPMTEEEMPGPGTSIGTVEEAKAKYTFTAIRAQVLPSCNGPSGCHRHGPFAAGLDLTDANAYASLVDVPSVIAPTKLRVVPGRSADSFLYQKLTDTMAPTGEGEPMPRSEGGIPWQELPDDQINLVKHWISNGAKDN